MLVRDFLRTKLDQIVDHSYNAVVWELKSREYDIGTDKYEQLWRNAVEETKQVDRLIEFIIDLFEEVIE